MSTAPQLRPFSASLPMALLQAREGAMRLFRPLLAEYDLTEQQWRVLRALTAAPGPLEPGELATRTFLLGPSLSRILSKLEDRGLIERATAAHDQRRALIGLRPAGSELVARIAPKSEATYRAIEDRFGTDRLNRLMDELHEFAAVQLEEIEVEAVRSEQ